MPGDVFIAPADRANPDGIAKKFISVKSADGLTKINTIEPELSDIYDLFEFDAVTVPSLSDLEIGKEGISLSRYEPSAVSHETNDAPQIGLGCFCMHITYKFTLNKRHLNPLRAASSIHITLQTHEHLIIPFPPACLSLQKQYSLFYQKDEVLPQL